MSDVICKNPHWIGDSPAWDIILSNGDVHTDVIDKDISKVLVCMHNEGLIRNGEQYICGVVRKCHIENYNKWFMRIKNETH
jgi:hypothetical protein